MEEQGWAEVMFILLQYKNLCGNGARDRWPGAEMGRREQSTVFTNFLYICSEKPLWENRQVIGRL